MNKTWKKVMSCAVAFMTMVSTVGAGIPVYAADEDVETSIQSVHTLSIAPSENGNITTSEGATEALYPAGEEVTLTVAADEGYEIDLIQLIRTDTGDILSEDAEAGEQFTFSMPDADVTVAGSFSAVETATEEAAEAQEEPAVSAESSFCEEQQTEAVGQPETVEQTEGSETAETEEVSTSSEKEAESTWRSLSQSEMDALVGYSRSEDSLSLASTLAVSDLGNYAWGGGYAPQIRSGNQLVYCLLPWAPTPSNGTSVNFTDYTIDANSDANLQLIAKLMYYGYGGGGNILTGHSDSEAEAITHFAVSKVWIQDMGCHAYYSWAKTGKSTLSDAAQQTVLNFIEQVKGLPKVKGSLHLASSFDDYGCQDFGYGSFSPIVTKGYLQISKKLNNASAVSGLSAYSATGEGCTFGVYSDTACTTCVATLTIGADGNSSTVQLNAGTYYVKELSAPAGYKLNSTVFSVKVTTDNTSTKPVSLKVADDELHHDRLFIKKTDRDNSSANADFSNVVVTVKYYDGQYSEADLPDSATRTWKLKMAEEDGCYSAELSDESLVEGSDDLFKSDDGAVIIPIGTITIEETEAGSDYVDGAYTIMDASGTLVTGKYLENITAETLSQGVIGISDLTLTNQVVRGDLEFTKTDDKGNVLAGVPFAITNKATKETHIVYSDVNGVVSTAGAKHSANTNANTETTGSSDNGVWFGDIDKVDDSLGALPYGTYTVKELSCEANTGKDLVSPFTVTVKENKKVVDKGTVVNNTPEIRTKAVEKTSGTQNLVKGQAADVQDTVSYTGLTEGRKYTAKAKLHYISNDGTDTIVDEKEQEFTAEASGKGTFTVDLKIASVADGNGHYVVTEQLYDGNHLCGFHEDMSDQDQSLFIPGVGTTAIDGATKDHVGTASKETTITDTVFFTGLQTDREYVVKGVLMDCSTGKELLVNGKTVTAEKTFTPKESAGSVKLTFTFDGSALNGETVVVFENLYNDGKQVAVHADIEDKNQTVVFPGVGTTAADGETSDNSGTLSEKAVINDTVHCTNLLEDKSYTIKGQLMNKATGEAIEGATAEKTFTAKGGDEDVVLTFTFDSTVLAGQDVVVFEDLYHNSIQVAAHADLNDEGQTVHYPTVKTTAKDAKTDSHTGTVSKEEVINDTVHCTNLVSGKIYTIKGRLMNKDTGEAIEGVTAEKTFTAKGGDEDVVLTFTFDSTLLEGETVVVFEDLYHENIKVATHSDLTDKKQSVEFPGVGTTAADGQTEDNVGTLSEKAVINDTVHCTNLLENKSYTIKGQLMNKATGEAIEGVTAEKTFTAKGGDEDVIITFAFDSTALAGQDVVVFEDLYHNSIQVAAHADLSDEGQTIHYPGAKTTAADGSTGTHSGAAVEEAVLEDTVHCTNLVSGKEYQIHGQLMNKATGEAIEGVTAEKTFTAKGGDEDVVITFTFDASLLKGQTVVAFENVTHNGIEVCAHADLNDTEQSVSYPSLSTKAADFDTKTKTGSVKKEAKIVDTVSYANLESGKTYQLNGSIADAETGEVLKDSTGKEITATATFTAGDTLVSEGESSMIEDNILNPAFPVSEKTETELVSGEAEVVFTFDSTSLDGKTIVVYEDLSLVKEDGAVLVCSHKDKTDEDQMVSYPQIGTTATVNGSKSAVSSGKITINDVVSYKNLTPGSYSVEGTLMDKATGKALLVNGQEVKASAEFTAEKADGSVTVQFTFDATGLGSKELVVFEKLFSADTKAEITSHEDLQDKGQTVTLTPPPVQTNTGDNNRAAVYGGLAVALICVAGIILILTKKKK